MIAQLNPAEYFRHDNDLCMVGQRTMTKRGMNEVYRIRKAKGQLHVIEAGTLFPGHGEDGCAT